MTENPVEARMQTQVDWTRDKSLFTLAPSFPREMLIELSNACNHACVFCTNSYMKRRVGRINSALLDRVLVEARGLGVTDVGFYTTGEPFIHKDLEHFVCRAAELGYGYIFITTNGALATPERSKAAIDAGLSSIKFSINAASEGTYRTVHGRNDFQAVLRHLTFVSEYRKTIGRPLALNASFVVNDLNRHEVELAGRVIAPLVDKLFFLDCDDTQMGQLPSLTEFLGSAPQRSRGRACPLPFERLHVSQEGYLNLCCTDYHNYLAVADLNEMPLAEAWTCEEFQSARRRHMEQALEGTLCHKCWFGSTGPVDPLVERFASRIDPDSFDDEVRRSLASRLGK